jgi:hypothetical protein
MDIYRKRRTSSTIYRKIYEQHFGPIPKDETGRSYEIHHIDGDSENNDPSNLVALTLQEHYDVHYSQGDFRACQFIAAKLKKSPEEIRDLHKLSIRKMIDNKTFNLCGGAISRKMNQDRMEAGIHLFQVNNPGPAVTDRRINDRTHNWVGENHPDFDHTVYKFENKITGEILECTRDYLIKTYKLNKGNTSSMLLGGRHKSVGGWRLKSV